MPEAMSLAARRAELARAERRRRLRPADQAAAAHAEALRSEYRTAKITDYIQRVVDSAPPLTTEQRDKLAVLLRGA